MHAHGPNYPVVKFVLRLRTKFYMPFEFNMVIILFFFPNQGGVKCGLHSIDFSKMYNWLILYKKNHVLLSYVFLIKLATSHNI